MRGERKRPGRNRGALRENPAAATRQRHDTPDPTQDDLFTAAARRDEGAHAAAHSAHPYWVLRAETWIWEQPVGRVVTSDDLYDAIGSPPGHANAVGGIFLAAARRGEIVAVGYMPSRKPGSNLRPVRQWRRTGDAR